MKVADKGCETANTSFCGKCGAKIDARLAFPIGRNNGLSTRGCLHVDHVCAHFVLPAIVVRSILFNRSHNIACCPDSAFPHISSDKSRVPTDSVITFTSHDPLDVLQGHPFRVTATHRSGSDIHRHRPTSACRPDFTEACVMFAL